MFDFLKDSFDLWEFTGQLFGKFLNVKSVSWTVSSVLAGEETDLGLIFGPVFTDCHGTLSPIFVLEEALTVQHVKSYLSCRRNGPSTPWFTSRNNPATPI
jgi:hypothetical protein